MLKHSIKMIKTTTRNTLEVTSSKSGIGNGERGGNSMQGDVKRNEFPVNLNIKIGDLVRCDGYPFKARPATYWEADTSKINISKLYKPFKLNNGYWVLRPTFTYY